MKRKAFLHLAASSLIFGSTMVGCTGAAFNAHLSVVSTKAEAHAGRFAASVESALAKRDVATALAAAEAAVAAEPSSAAYRALLGRAYFASGRFLSAETAFQDAMTLGNRDTRTIVSLALAQAAQGKGDAARAVLAANRDNVPASDYGLAVAMTGDAEEAIRVLSAAVHDNSADATTRQNLAYAYALAGRWREARLMAGQDLDPLSATQRVAQWAQTAERGAEAARIAAFVGAPAGVLDAGMPVRLALAPAAPVQMAEADVEPAEAVPAETAETAVAESALAEAVVSELPSGDAAAVAFAEQEPAAAVSQREMRSASIEAPRALALSRPTLRKVALIRPVESGASPWVVQVGAFDSPAVARDSWQRMARANSRLADFPVVNSTATVNGRVYHRVALSGFSDRQAADRMCRSLRSAGRACFVRAGSGAAPERWAAPAKAPTRQQLASR